MIEIISGAWAAGETKTFQIAGQYIEILDAQYSCDVVLMDRTGSQQSFMRGAEASFFTRPGGGFETVQITSAQAQVIRVFIGSGDAGTRRISSVVQVVDGERARVNAQAVFAGSSYAAPTASVYPQCQLWNPAGSGKRVVLRGASFTSATAQGVTAVGGTVALATDQSGSRSGNKLIVGGPGFGAGIVRAGNTAIVPGGSAIYGVNLASNVLSRWDMTAGPFVIMPGIGLTISGNASGAELGVNWEWFEEAI